MAATKKITAVRMTAELREAVELAAKKNECTISEIITACVGRVLEAEGYMEVAQ